MAGAKHWRKARHGGKTPVQPLALLEAIGAMRRTPW
jgi:hypothetical protein